MEWILVLGSVSREKKEPRSSDKVQTTCPRGRKMAKASERADGREEVGSEGTKAVDLITLKHQVCCRKPGMGGYKASCIVGSWSLIHQETLGTSIKAQNTASELTNPEVNHWLKAVVCVGLGNVEFNQDQSVLSRSSHPKGGRFW